MKKLSVLFFLLIAVAYVLPTKANFFNYFNKQLNEAQEKITKVINGGIQTIQEEVDKDVEKAVQIMNQMKQEGENLIDDFHIRVDATIADMEKKINEITNGVDDNIIDECNLISKGAKQVKDLALAILANSSFCVTDKIDQVSEYIENINDASQEAINSLLQINNEAVECTEDINDIESTVKAAACLGSASARATWAVGTQIPTVILNMGKLGFLVSTLPPSLSLCASITTMSLIIDEANSFVSSVNDCIQHQLSVYSTSVPGDGTFA